MSQIAFPPFFPDYLNACCGHLMISNYYTLRHIARDLNQQLAGMRPTDAFSQERNQIVFTFMGGSQNPSLVISCEPAANYLFIRSMFARAKKNTIDFFSPIMNRQVEAVWIHPLDRQIVIEFDAPESLVIQLYGSLANVYMVDKIGRAHV